MVRSPRVLVIDDDHQIANAISTRLNAVGWKVRCEYDGVAGLDAVSEWQPHAVVLDIRMPKLDGLTVLARINGNPATRQIPVLVLSASAVDERDALDGGAYCFLAKPYDASRLMETIRTAIESSLSVH